MKHDKTLKEKQRKKLFDTPTYMQLLQMAADLHILLISLIIHRKKHIIRKKKKQESNSQLHNEVQVGRAFKDILQGDDVGVLDSEEDRPKPSHTWQTSSATLPPGGAVAAQFQQRITGFLTVHKANCENLWEDLSCAWLCGYNKWYSHSPTENNLVMNQPAETWASLLAAEHTPEHMNTLSLQHDSSWEELMWL